MASAELAALSFELSRERLDKQERVLDELRSRTGVLLAASVRKRCTRRLAYDLDRFWEENDKRFRQLRRGFEVAATGLVVEVLALVALVADTI